MTDIDVIAQLSRINPRPSHGPPPIAALLDRLDEAAPPSLLARRRWRPPALAFGGVAAGGAAIVLIALLGAGGGTPNVAAEMYQATTPGSGVLHMSTLTEMTVGSQTRTSREEIWSEQNPRRLRLVLNDGEETIESALSTVPMKLLQWSEAKPDQIVQSVPTGIAMSEQTGVQILRGLYSKGELTNAGQTTADGQAAWLLEVHPQQPLPTLGGRPVPNPTVAVSASTFVPLEFTDYSVTSEHGTPEELVTKVHYTAYEELPRNPQDEASLELAAHPGATVKPEG